MNVGSNFDLGDADIKKFNLIARYVLKEQALPTQKPGK